MLSTILIAILNLAAGIGVFLVACQMMSKNLESAGSKRLKRLFNRAGKSSGSSFAERWIGVGIGTVGTAAIQSSGAVTVMVIGFVNVGIISLSQAATIIYGANIGTTITAQLVALGMFGTGSISSSLIFAAFAGIGAFIMMFAKKDILKQTGAIITGFGMLFVGLSIMQNAMEDFAAMESVKLFLASISNPLLLVIVGAVLTAIIQSSSVMTSIALTMVVTGLVSLDQGIFLTMGSNIGSCVVALLAGLTSGINAKRTALIHLLFNTMGVVIFLILAWVISLASAGETSFARLFAKMFPDAPQVQLAMFHTVFNICTMLVAMPLTDLLVKAVCKILPDKPAPVSDDEPHLYYFDKQMLKTPVVAIRQLKAEVENMSLLAIENFRRSMHIVKTLDFAQEDKFWATEKQLNFLNRELTQYAVLLSDNQLNQFDHQYLASVIRTSNDLERIGDYAKNIVEYAQSLRQHEVSFSEYALREIEQMSALIDRLYDATMQAYHKLDFAALGRANQIEDEVDVLSDEMQQNHIQRLALNICSPKAGNEYISLAQNAERVADHLINVAKSIRQLKVQ